MTGEAPDHREVDCPGGDVCEWKCDLHEGLDQLRILEICHLPGCWRSFTRQEGAGRPRRYCGDEHRREAQNLRRRTVARLELLREQVRRDEHLLAALGGEQQ